MKTYGRKASSGERASQKFAETFASLSNSRENQLPVVQNQTVQYVPTEIISKPSLMDMAQIGRKKRQTSSESKHKKRNCSFDQTDNEKREILRQKIRCGQQSHISHLQERMDEFNEKGQAGFGFRVASPMLWKRVDDTNDQNQWLKWMLTLGFDGPTSEICPNVCCYPEAKIDDLVKALRGIDLSVGSLTTHPDFIVRERARSESFASMNSGSTSSNMLAEIEPPSGRRSLPPTLLNIHVDSDDSSMYSPWSQCNTGGSNNTFSRPNSSRSHVNPSPLESAFMAPFKDMSLTSPRGSFTSRLESSPLIKPRVTRMNRISEIDDAVSNDSTPFKLPPDETVAGTMAMDTSFTSALPSTMEEDEVDEMIATNEHHHCLDPLSEVSTVKDEDSILEDDEEVAATQLTQFDNPSSPHAKTTMMNMMMVDDGTSHFFSPQPARQSSSFAAGAGLAERRSMGSILPPRFLTSSITSANGNHHQLSKPHEVRFSNALLTSPEARDVFAPISKRPGSSMVGILGGGNGAFHPTTDHEPTVSNVRHRRQLQRRSNTLPAPHTAAVSSHNHRGDVTPGGISLSQNAVENYVTPQGKFIGEIDPFMKSTPTHPTIIDAMTKKFLEELHRLERIHDVNISLRDLRFDCSGYQLILGGPVHAHGHHLHQPVHSHSYHNNCNMPEAVVLQRATSVPLALEGPAVTARLSYPGREYTSNHDFSLLRNSTGSLDASSSSPFALMLNQNHHINHHRGSAGGPDGHAIYRQSSDSINSGGISLLIGNNNQERRESSLLSTPPHSQQDGRDSSVLASHQVMMFTKGSTTSSNEVSQRKKLKKRQAKAKYRRLSLQVNSTSNMLFENSDTSVNMSVDNSHHSNNNNNDRRKSMAFCSASSVPIEAQESTASNSNKTVLGDIMEDEEFFNNNNDSDRVSDNRKVDGIDAENMMKQAIIIGGAFHGRYDNSCPVVTAPSTLEKRVDDLRFTHVNDLSIRLYVPGDQNSHSQGGRWIDLGADWCWLSCSPVGYLVGKAHTHSNTSNMRSGKCILYYLPKHPAQWNAFSVPEQSQGGAMDEEEEEVEAHEDMMMIQDDFDFHSTTHAPHQVQHANKAILPATSKMVQLPSKAMHEILSFLPLHDQFQACLTLSKPWAIATIKSLASNISLKMWSQRGSKESWDKFVSFIQSHPRGKFLSDGAYKHVYCVNSNARLDALSVMDVDDLRSRGIEVVANQELIISLLSSALISLRICPNMIRVYDVFQADYDTASWKTWSSGIHSISDLFEPVKALDKRMIIKKNFEKTQAKKVRYQYCQMEFCSGGDVEELVRKVTMLSTEQVKGFLWQMLYAMYAARETLGMRHYDIKLLNFFATSNSNQTQSKQMQEEDLFIGFGRFLYRIDCSSSPSNDMPTVIKLADFGTSVIGNETMGIPITMQQFTTLENTPPEFLLLGDSARQSYASDTFCLGLSFLHLLTGHEPYEVLMKDIRCPRYLKEKLRDMWNPNDINDPYSVIKITIKSLEEHDPHDDEDEDHSLMMNDDSINDILCDTIYRYLVLLGGSSALENGFVCNQLYQYNPAWKVITHSLNLLQQQASHNAQSTNQRRRANNNHKPSKASTADPWMECVQAYQNDIQHWSIQSGDDPHMQRVRARLQDLGPGAEQLLESLLHFDPAQRCTMYDALHHPNFASMRVTPEQAVGGSTVSVATSSTTRRKNNNNNQKAVVSAPDTALSKLASSSSHYLYYFQRNGTSSLDDGLLLL